MAGKGAKCGERKVSVTLRPVFAGQVEVSRERGARWWQRGWGKMGQDRGVGSRTQRKEGLLCDPMWGSVSRRVASLRCDIWSTCRCMSTRVPACVCPWQSCGGVAPWHLISQAPSPFPQPQGLSFKGFLAPEPGLGEGTVGRPWGSRFPHSKPPAHGQKFSSLSLLPCCSFPAKEVTVFRPGL